MPDGFFERVIYVVETYWRSLLSGTINTLIIALVGTAIGCIIGLLVGTVQTIPVDKKRWSFQRVLITVVKGILYIYVEVFRGTPMMVQAMFIYYGFQYAGVSLQFMFAAFIIVSINTGAYMAETVRGGILSIDPGQTEGAKAIGMSHWQTMRCVILPQAIRNIMPQIGNNLIINIKDTCVLSVISVVELFFASKAITGALYIYFEVFTVTMIIYLCLTIPASRILRYVERRMDGPENYDLATTDTLAHTSGMYSYTEKEKSFYSKEDQRPRTLSFGNKRIKTHRGEDEK